MQKEIEIKYFEVDHNTVRKKLIALEFVCVKEKTEYNCHYFHFEEDKKIGRNRWGRIKDDGAGSIMMGIKEKFLNEIGGVGEVDLYIDSVERGFEFFHSVGMLSTHSQAMTREKWFLESENVGVVLDHWSHIESSIEIESDDVSKLEKYSELLGFDFTKAGY